MLYVFPVLGEIFHLLMGTASALQMGFPYLMDWDWTQ